MRTFIALLLVTGLSWAQETELERLRKDLDEAKTRIDALEKHESTNERHPGDLASMSLGGGASARLIEVSLDILACGGWSTARNDELAALNGGHHDPHLRGFTLQNAELSLSGAVDPFFKAEAHVGFVIDQEGESRVELEEAFFTTTCLPWGFEIRGGHMNLEFGRINRQHPHEWSFVDAPVVFTRFFGEDALRSQGARLSWAAPTPFHLGALLGVYNAKGEGAFSFLFDEEENTPFPSTFVDRTIRSGRDMLYLGRIEAGIDIGETLKTRFGASWAHGPNPTGFRADTDLFGIDLFARWQPREGKHGWPFVEFHAEAMMRRFERGAGTDYGHEVFQDWGAYAQVVVGFAQRWTAGIRADLADGEIDEENPLHDHRLRISPALTFHPTEFSRIRLQYNVDHASHLPKDRVEHSVWLQVEVQIGKHEHHDEEAHEHDH